jgi:hypothetical protein
VRNGEPVHRKRRPASPSLEDLHTTLPEQGVGDRLRIMRADRPADGKHSTIRRHAAGHHR